MLNKVDPKIIVALDYDDIKLVQEKLRQLDAKKCRIKIGKTLFTRYGPSVVQQVIAAGFSVFLDLKFHDIPNQVAGAVKAAADLGVWMLTLHAMGGQDMMMAAKKSIADISPEKRPLLIAVTILTSLNDQDVQRIGFQKNIKELVPDLAKLAEKSGLDGIVCSPLEIESVRQIVSREFLIVTPGIRLASDAHQDQKRVMTPEEAFNAGADYLVIGRSITLATNPNKTLSQICK